MRILIADDDVFFRQLLETVLAPLGHEVTVAEDGREAWELFQARPFQMVLCDWMMPEMDGMELIRNIRAGTDDQYVYTILLSVRRGKEDVLQGFAAGADDFMGKPFDQRELLARLKVAERILDMQAHIRRLQGLLPICSYCKRIRDDQDAWHRIESYISQHSEARFSHGICPECYHKHVEPQLDALHSTPPEK